MAVTSDRLYVTYVDAYNGLLKIWGQPNRTCATYIEKQLLQLVPEFNRSSGPSPANIRKGMFCFAKYEDESYYRAKVISDVLNNSVFVLFIDYGNRDCVELSNVRILNSPAESIITTIVPQAEEYYLANIKSEGGWSQQVMNDIRRGLCYSEYKYRTVCHSGNDKLIQISYRNEDYSSCLIRQDLAKPVSVKEQILLLRSTFKNQTMEPVSNTFRGSSFNQHVPQQTNRDNFFMQNKAQHGPTTQEHINQPVQVNQQPMLPQPVFTPPQNRSGIVNNERHFNVMNPPQKVVFNQSSNNVAYQEVKSTPVINTVVIEALANQLKQHLLKDQLTPVGESSTQGYVTQVLDVKTTHNVYISYIDDGPWSFSVQLVSNEHELNQLMDELAAYNFQPIKLPLVLGSPCIAKSRQYENYCRGVLVNITHSAVKVFFVDFGNTEDLPVNMLFEMPVKFFKFKTMSQKFALSGLQRVKPTEEIKKAFVDVVENELLILHVTNLEGENLPTCDLYLKDVNIKRILNEKLRQVKNWEPVQFPRPGEIENVLVTWVESAQKFYVQLKRREPELKDLKMELANLGMNGEHFDPEEILPGTICICFFSGDNNWYRAVITSVNATKTVTVFYIDYGNTEEVDVKKIKRAGCGIITKIKTQAIPCCLQGYENASPNSSIKAALADLIFEKEFSLKVVSGEKDRMIVQLFDNGKDISLFLKNVTFNLKSNISVSDTKDMSDNYFAECDLGNKKSSAKGTNYSSGKNGPDRTESGKSRKKEAKNEKAKTDFLSWRLDENNKRDFSPRGKEDGKNTKARDVKESGSEAKNDKHDGGKSGRYGFKGKKGENVKSNDRDQKNWEKNWRGTEGFGGKSSGGETRNKPKLGESISERMKRAARENEARGLKLSESIITKLPVKLENIAFHGHEFEKKEVEIGSTEDVIVTYFVNPNEIYLQLVSSKEKFRHFMIDIHNYYSTKLPLLNKPKKGDVVVAKFQQDGVLYRAVVIETEPITVRYVDFGNEEISEKEHLWPMDKMFLELESQCLKCTLPNLKPVESDTWPVPNPEMDNIFEYETYSCTFLKKLHDGYEVKLVVSGRGIDVRDELISCGFASSVEETVESPVPMKKHKIHTSMVLDLICGDIINIYISHIVNTTEFYVQIRCSEVELILEEISKYVAKEKPVASGDIDNGELYMVNVESGGWYRAEVIEKKEVNVTVRLVDYGEELSVGYEQVRPISEDLAKYPPQAVKCSLFIDQSVIDDKLIEFLQCDKNCYSAFFHEVSDQRMKLTLYDFYGERLAFFDCDEYAPAFIRPIAELPIISRQARVTTSHINSPKDIYIQLLSDAEELKELTSLLRNFYSNKEDSGMEGSLSEYELYAAESVSDHSWYRAQLLSQTDESAKMLYIDFGIAEEVPKQNLRQLDFSFYDGHAYAKKVSVNIDYDEESENIITDKLRQLIGEKTCTGYFVKVGDIVYGEFVIDGSFVTPQLVSSPVNERKVGLFEKNTPNGSDEGLKVFIAHVSHPGEFWVHEESISCELSTFQDKLQAACSNGIQKEDVEEGDIVGALFKDKLWYRALVTSVEDDIITVRFLDYGNTFDIDKSENEFILLNEELKNPPSFARKCSLKGFWKKDATSKFEDIVMNYEDTFTLIQVGDEEDKVDLLQNGSSITEQLIKEGYGEEENNDTIFITHINSPDEFYIQKESDQELFDMIINELLETSSMEDAVDVRVDELYCARYPEDDLWYRARVLSKDENDVVVSFIDYGNCSSVTEIKELPQKLKSLRPLAMKCCLANEKSDDIWSETARNAFCKYLNNVPFKMEVVEQGSQVNAIRLFTENGEDIREMLDGLSEGIGIDEPEPIDNEIVFSGKQNSLVCQDNLLYADSADSCPSEMGESDAVSAENDDANIFKTGDSPEKTPDLSKSCTEKIVPGCISLGENSNKDNDNSKCVKKLSHSEKMVPGCVTRGVSLEEVPVGNIESEEKLTQNSFSAPVTPSIPRRQQQSYKKNERDDKPLPGSISNSNLAIAQDKIAHDEKQVAANVNGTMKDIQD